MNVKGMHLIHDHTEQRLVSISDGDIGLYDKAHVTLLENLTMVDDNGAIGVFRAFTYRNSLRLLVLLQNSPSEETADWIVSEIEHYAQTTDKSATLAWYAQTNGFSRAVIERLKNAGNPYHFDKYAIEHDEIDPNVDIRGLSKRKCTEDMVDACIEVMEDLFTPFPDPPGSYRDDRERIKSEYLDYVHGGAELFFLDGELVGFCGHHDGHLAEVCVRKPFQGRGYGEAIVRSVLKTVYDAGLGAQLTTGAYNSRAIRLYEKVGFKRVYESIRVTLAKPRVSR